MKRKINSRTLTLILLIGAMICAVLASLAFFNLFDSKNKNVETASAASSFNIPFTGATSEYSIYSNTIAIPWCPYITRVEISLNKTQGNITCWNDGEYGVSSDQWTVESYNNFSYIIVPGGLSIGEYPIEVHVGSGDDNVYYGNIYVDRWEFTPTFDWIIDYENRTDEWTIDDYGSGLNYTAPSGWNVYDNGGYNYLSFEATDAAVGDYTFTLRNSDNGYLTVPGGSITLTIKVRRISNELSLSGSKSHTWTTNSTTVNAYPGYHINVTWPSGWSHNGNRTLTIPGSAAAGTYNIPYTPQSGYVWDDDTTTTKYCTYTISKAALSSTLSNPTLASSSKTWSASSQTFTINNYTSYTNISLPSGWSRNGSTVTIPANASAGSYNITFTPDSNHTWSSGGTGNVTRSITIGRAAINEPTLSKTSTAWSASSQTFTISTITYMTVSLPSGWTRSGTTVTIPASTAVGYYEISFSPDSNHQWNGETSESGIYGTRSLNISITRAPINVPTLSPNSLAYSTRAQTFALSTTNYISSVSLPSGWSRSGATVTVPASTTVGSYSLSVTPDGNHMWTDNSSSAKTISFSITQATPTANPTVAAGTYVSGNLLSSVGITGTASFEGAALSGTFYWSDPSKVLETGAVSYEWTFEPADTHNFKNLTGNVKVAAIAIDYITVTGAKTRYKAYEAFTEDGMTVSAVAGSTSTPVTDYTLSIPYTDEGRSYFLFSDNGCVITVNYFVGGKNVSTTINITVVKADYDMSGVTMSDSTVTYDGNSHTVVYSGSLPDGVHLSKYNYNGEAATGATNAGTYNVEAIFTVDDAANYNVPELGATLVINKATPTVTVTVSGGRHYYGDELGKIGITVNTSDVNGRVSWTDGTETLVTDGSYGWTFTPDDAANYNQTTGFESIAVEYRLQSIRVYNAVTDYEAFDEFDVGVIEVEASYLGKASETVTGWTISYPGSTRYFLVSDDGKNITVHYTAPDGTEVTAEVTVNVAKKNVDMSGVEMPSATYTYDGAAHSVIVANTPEYVVVSGYLYNGDSAESATESGTYTVTAVYGVTDEDNVEIPASTTATLTIDKAAPEIDVSGMTTEYVYTGLDIEVNSGATVNNAEQTVEYANNVFRYVADSGVLTLSVAESKNYTSVSKEVEIVITHANLQLEWSGGDGVYDGTTHSAGLDIVGGVAAGDIEVVTTDDLASKITVSYTGADPLRKAVGVYEPNLDVFPTDGLYANYTYEITNSGYIFEITASDAEIEFVSEEVEYDGETHNITASGVPEEVTVKYYYKNTTNEFNGETNVNYNGTEVAGYEITAKFSCDTGNYTVPADKTATLTITPREIVADEVYGIEESYTYKGSAWKPVPEVKLLLNGNEITLGGGDYSVSYSTEDYNAGTEVNVIVEGSGNYGGTAEKTFEITKALLGIEWQGADDTFVYSGSGQGVSAKLTNVAESDKDRVLPTLMYNGVGGTAYAGTDKPINAGYYSVTVSLSEEFANYETFSSTSRNFEIKKATVTPEVAYKDYNEGDDVYEGSAVPELEITVTPTLGEITVNGTLVCTQTSLLLGTNEYEWVFTPDDGDNFNTVTIKRSIIALRAEISSLLVDWRDDIEIPDIYLSTTLDTIRGYIRVTGVLTGGAGTVEVSNYVLTGSWGGGDTPSTAGKYSLTVRFNSRSATLTDVEYIALSYTLKIEAADGGIKTDYKGLDTFDRSTVCVIAVRNDGVETEVQDYEIEYVSGDALWVGDTYVTVAYTADGKTVYAYIENLTVTPGDYDLSGIVFPEEKNAEYDGETKAYGVTGNIDTDSISVSYVYEKLTDDGYATCTAGDLVNAGAYRITARFTLLGDKNTVNYNPISNKISVLTVDKAYYDVSAIVFDDAETDYAGGKSLADTITVKNLPAGVTAVYGYVNSKGETVAADNLTDAGEYTVTVSFTVDSNHNPITARTAKLIVNKVTPEIEQPLVGGNLNAGTKLGDLTFSAPDGIPGRFVWDNEEQVLEEGMNRCSYTFIPDDTVNYKPVKGYVDWTISGGNSDNAVTEQSGGTSLSGGLLAGIAVALAAVLIVAVISLIVALTGRRKSTDSDGFYDDYQDPGDGE